MSPINLFLLLLFMMLVSCSEKQPIAITQNDIKKPGDNRFIPVVLTTDGDFDEPINFEVLKDGKVSIIERK